MVNEQRKHERKASKAYFRVHTEIPSVAHTVPLQNVSLGGAFVQTEYFPKKGETITFDVLDKYGLLVMRGYGEVVRIVDIAPEDSGMGFAVQFIEELELAMMDFLAEVCEEDVEEDVEMDVKERVKNNM